MRSPKDPIEGGIVPLSELKDRLLRLDKANVNEWVLNVCVERVKSSKMKGKNVKEWRGVKYSHRVLRLFISPTHPPILPSIRFESKSLCDVIISHLSLFLLSSLSLSLFPLDLFSHIYTHTHTHSSYNISKFVSLLHVCGIVPLSELDESPL